jgi:hypothetical protein
VAWIGRRPKQEMNGNRMQQGDCANLIERLGVISQLAVKRLVRYVGHSDRKIE